MAEFISKFWQHDYETRLQELSELEDGWNGSDTVAISPESIKLAKEILSVLPFRVRIYPDMEGDGLLLEWDREDGGLNSMELYSYPKS